MDKKTTKGLIQYLSEFATEDRLIRFNEVLDNRTRYISVVLEELYQEHNASAVLRTCDCFGIQDVHVFEGKNKFNVNDSIALGASKWISVYKHKLRGSVLSDTILELKKNKYRIVATVPDAEAKPIHKFDLHKGKIALLFGSELHGLSDDIKSFADEFLYIPMSGFTESFNISVSAGIILYFFTQQLRNSKLSWKLRKDEKDELILNWLRESVKSSELLEAEYLQKKV